MRGEYGEALRSMELRVKGLPLKVVPGVPIPALARVPAVTALLGVAILSRATACIILRRLLTADGDHSQSQHTA